MDNGTAHPISLTQLAAISQLAGEDAQASEYIEKLRKLRPDWDIEQAYIGISHFKDKTYVERFLEALRRAGLPDRYSRHGSGFDPG